MTGENNAVDLVLPAQQDSYNLRWQFICSKSERLGKISHYQIYYQIYALGP
jgi:hypothetical protein